MLNDCHTPPPRRPTRVSSQVPISYSEAHVSSAARCPSTQQAGWLSAPGLQRGPTKVVSRCSCAWGECALADARIASGRDGKAPHNRREGPKRRWDAATRADKPVRGPPLRPPKAPPHPIGHRGPGEAGVLSGFSQRLHGGHPHCRPSAIRWTRHRTRTCVRANTAFRTCRCGPFALLKAQA